MQSSDKVVLPEARVNFNQLVEFLLDRGARLSPRGINNLSDLGAQTQEGITLMAVGPELGADVMMVAKPRTHYTALSVQLHWPPDLQSTGRNRDSLPLTSIEVQPLWEGDDTQ